MDFSKNFEKIETAGYVISVMKQSLYKNYSVLVDGVISGEIKDAETIRKIVCDISDYLEEERFRELGKSLCEYVQEKYPEIEIWRLL